MIGPGRRVESGAHLAVEAELRAERRRYVAVVLPELLNELACARASRFEAPKNTEGAGCSDFQRALKQPSAVVLTDSNESVWDAATRLDAVSAAARERGVRPRQTIAEASALVGNLKVLGLNRARIRAALQQVAEVALGFGSPASFDELDTVWLEISGSTHLFGTEAQLAALLAASIRVLGHEARVAVADGPWAAGALARHTALDESAVLVVPSNETAKAVATLPILALPIGSETVAWFAQLGLLFIDDLRKLPSASLAARLPERQPTIFDRLSPFESGVASVPGIELCSMFDLIRGADESVLIPYHPEEAPFEESTWDDPLNDVEPLLFVSKGLASRLGARLEGRGQAAQKLLLTVQYDRSIAALESAATGKAIVTSHEIHFELATPLAHAEDIERVVRSRLQREILAAPATGLSLRATAITRAQSWQPGLCSAFGLGSDIVPEARSIAVLVAELEADIGSCAVGVLSMGDSHLLEKSSLLIPIGAITSSDASCLHVPVSSSVRGHPGQGAAGTNLACLSLPTRLLSNPLELTGSLDPGELWVLGQQAFVVRDVRFEERLEAIEWWENEPIERDYFRVWLTRPQTASSSSHRHGHTARRFIEDNHVERGQRPGEGIEVLAYRDRESGRSYVQAVYD